MDRLTLVVLAARVGDPVDARDFVAPTVDRVIAVDSGLHLATHLGLDVDIVVGDLDSVDPELVAQARGRGIEVEIHPRDKEHTDLALALDRARRDGATEILVLGGAGGRIDHGLANLLALADPALAGIRVRAHLGGARITVIREDATVITGTPGDLVSIIAVGAPASVVSDGLRWDLNDEVLTPTSTRGVSNEFRAAQARVRTTDGVVLILQPANDEALGT